MFKIGGILGKPTGQYQPAPSDITGKGNA